MGIEQLLAIQLDAVRNPDVADGPAGARGTDRLHHRLLCADAFEHGVSADSFRQVFDAGNCFVTALDYDIGCAELAGELLPWRVTAHRNDPARAHLFGGEDAEQPDRAVAHDRDCCARLHVRSNGGEPTCAHDVGNSKEARDEVGRRQFRRCDQRTVSERDAQQRRLRGAYKLPVLA